MSKERNENVERKMRYFRPAWLVAILLLLPTGCKSVHDGAEAIAPAVEAAARGAVGGAVSNVPGTCPWCGMPTGAGPR
jgi:hypothetical protein